MQNVRCSYGVDVSGDRVTLVCSTWTRGGIHHEVLLDSPASELAPLAARVRDDVNAGKATLSAAMGVHESFARPLKAPFPSIAKARKVFPSLLDIQLPFPVEKCVCHFLEPRLLPDRQVETIAVAAREDNIQSCLGRLSSLGLDPVVLDHEGLALWTFSCDDIPLEKDVVRVVVYVGHDRTVLALGRHDQFIGAHSTRIGLRDLTSPDTTSMAASLQQLTSRINQVLSAHVRGADDSPMQWAWAGLGAEQTAIMDAIRSSLPSSLHITPFIHNQPSSFLARALSARALQPGALRCNFRAEKLEHAQTTAHREQNRLRAAAGCLAAGLLLCVLSGIWLAALGARNERLQSAVSALALDVSRAARVPRGQEVLVTERTLAEQAPLIMPFTESFKPSLRETLRAMLDVAAGRQLILESATLRKDAILVNGSALDWTRCEALAEPLRNDNWRVEVERHDAGADERVHFTLKALR